MLQDRQIQLFKRLPVCWLAICILFYSVICFSLFMGCRRSRVGCRGSRVVTFTAISSPPPPSLPITRHHLHPPPLSVAQGLPLKIKISFLQTVLPWPIWSFPLPISTTPTLTAIVPSCTLEIGPELLLTPPLETPFDSSQRSWISWCPGALSFWVAL